MVPGVVTQLKFYEPHLFENVLLHKQSGRESYNEVRNRAAFTKVCVI